MMGAKHLKMTKYKLHATKPRSPDEIRVWQLVIDYKYCVIDYTSLKWFENVLSQVVTLEIWNLMF